MAVTQETTDQKALEIAESVFESGKEYFLVAFAAQKEQDPQTTYIECCTRQQAEVTLLLLKSDGYKTHSRPSRQFRVKCHERINMSLNGNITYSGKQAENSIAYDPQAEKSVLWQPMLQVKDRSVKPDKKLARGYINISVGESTKSVAELPVTLPHVSFRNKIFF